MAKRTRKNNPKTKQKPEITFTFITIFPSIFDSYLRESLVKRAVRRGLIGVRAVDLRDFSESRHRKVDDKPFGGGPGMVISVEPVYRALRSLKKKRPGKEAPYVVLPSTRGAVFNAESAKRLSRKKEIIFVCGRYEGVDERVAEHLADEEISMGDFVLSGGELAAMTVMEAVCRFIPGFLGKTESREDIKGYFPSYTRPEVFKPKGGNQSWKVPEVLLSGNHEAIEKWRKQFGNGD